MVRAEQVRVPALGDMFPLASCATGWRQIT